MARLKSVTINKFKGIRSTTLSLDIKSQRGRFITLIGLNESGKTTVLEGIAHSALADPETASLIETVQGSAEHDDLIPKQHKASFTGIINVVTKIELSIDDIRSIERYLLEKHSFIMKRDSFSQELVVNRQYHFENSSYSKTFTTWNFAPTGKRVRGKKPITINSDGDTKVIWFGILDELRRIVPRAIYFPTFLISFPDRIYLEGDHGATDKYYRDVTNEVLKSLKQPLTIEDHILARVRKFRDESENSGFGSKLRRAPEGQSIDAVVRKMAGELNRVIFGAWNDIFGQKIIGKRINVEWHIDEGKGNHAYIEIYILDGDDRYYIGQRSLGFRWFFSFLLFTQFNSARRHSSETIFLFDEPASHLHARAQMKLLESFERIADPNHRIVYSTHSHYMINPAWLEGAYIVENRAVDVEDDFSSEFSSPEPDIQVTPYKKFVSENPSSTTYFQPVLDALDHRIDHLTLMPATKAVILEGKYDYYPFRVLKDAVADNDGTHVYPATGAGNMASLISLFRAWDVNFVILLDDDAAGRKERDRYRSILPVESHEVITLGDADPHLDGKAFEGIFGSDVIDLFPKYGINIQRIPTKQDFYLLFQGIVHVGATPSLPKTATTFKKVYDALWTTKPDGDRKAQKK